LPQPIGRLALGTNLARNHGPPPGIAVIWCGWTRLTNLNVSLTPELTGFIAARIASCRGQTASEVIQAGLRRLERSELREGKAAPRPGTAEPRRREGA
jgi:putative addiction module CopG family antidote